MTQHDEARGERDETERRKRSGRSAARARAENQTAWVEQQVRIAQERGDFDDLPGAGKPIEGLGETHDPDWWLKKLVEREQVSVLPPALAIRKEDAELEGLLDSLAGESEVRRELTEFNERVLKARIQPLGGPPMITMPRDVEAEVTAWRERRTARVDAARAARAATRDSEPRRRRLGWWRARSS